MVAAESPARPIDPEVRIGHVHLRTADIDRVHAFYVGVLGFEVTAQARGVPGWGTTGDVLFVSAGGYHHHLGFNTWKSAGGAPQPDGVAGLHHVAIRYPTQAALGDALARLRGAEWPLRTAIDHGTHVALYLSDPDGNDLELCGTVRSRSGRSTPTGDLHSPATGRSTSKRCSPPRAPADPARAQSSITAMKSAEISRGGSSSSCWV
jgi:catechol 2,3-dioxygenase